MFDRRWLRAGNLGKWAWGALMVAGLIAVLISLGSRSSSTQATWIWNAEQIESEPERIVAFAHDHHVNLIYLHIEPVNVSPEAYRSFIKKAAKAGIRVEALGGDPSWALTESRSSISNLIAWVKAYNNRAAVDERFQGIHVDIEPYLLDGWRRDQDGIVRQWLDNVAYMVAETKKDTKLSVGADLPFWIDTISVPGKQEKVSSWMLDRLDSITLMAYRNRAAGHNGIVDIVRNIVVDADTRQKASVIVGVNILESSEGDNVSFHAEGSGAMMNELAILQQELSAYPAFAGSAIHDYESWQHASLREEKR